MRAEFSGVWSYLWDEVWSVLAEREEAPADLFSEVYRELVYALKDAPSVEQIAEVSADPSRSAEMIRGSKGDELLGERHLVGFLEAAYDVVEDLGGDALAQEYRDLVVRFIERYSLRYDVRPPFHLCTTVQGMFVTLAREVKRLSAQDDHLDSLMRDFEDAVSDLRQDSSESRIRTCMVKQVNLLEAIASQHPEASQATIGAICNELSTWPHDGLRDAMKSVYRFTCDYPGIRHAGTPSNAHRPIDMRDLVVASILLMGFVPYLSDGLDAELIYHAS